ncbi:thioredoxin domain-containing protein [Fluviicola taffensis]|uniref:Thioredoxin domain-containing protein n=1 Tax=Fluviicola taffensis (strain DSM 16823 / NCIMB 13979 / RW262) TaxID=755732 RepID=F2IJT7_FLUTR|nr:thioredoxin domain-containing protein [Fluviicola taffensis]AEA44996.1 Thioredoxin domain-containing protein [Fluviicola taffensis DSM 16823]
MKQILLASIVFLFTACSNGQSTNLNAEQFASELKANPEATILDVRTAGEFEGGHIENAKNADWNGSDFDQKIKDLDPSQPVFVYCLSGGRSASAAAHLREKGFKKVYELNGGILSWRNARMPESTVTTKPTASSVSPEDYAKLIASGDVIIVDFYAPWCAPCKRMEPMLNQLSKDYEGKAKIIRIDIDQSKELATQMGITQIPLFIGYKEGKETGKHIGEASREQLVKKFGL